MPEIVSHGRANHLVYELVGEAGLLHGFIDGLVQHLGEIVPSEGVKEPLVAAEGVVVRLVAIDPLTGEKEIRSHQLHNTCTSQGALIMETEFKRSVAVNYLLPLENEKNLTVPPGVGLPRAFEGSSRARPSSHDLT